MKKLVAIILVLSTAPSATLAADWPQWCGPSPAVS